MLKSRIFNIMQYERHPDTGEQLLNEDKIKATLLSHRMIKRWAYVCHDKDVYSALDEEQNSNHKEGELKPRHWHIVIELGTRQIEISIIAKWFGIADNFVETAKGAGAFLDCVKYLTHEDNKQKELGKRLYEDTCVCANFDFRAELDKRAENKAKYGRDLNERDRFRNEVLYHGMTLRQIIEQNPLAYQADFPFLERCRLKYISKIADIPKIRINYYIEGAGGIGKGLISRAIARALIDESGTMREDDIYFEVGADKATFEGYDGQPVIIWNDCRAITLLEKLDGRENVFNVFDPFPSNIQQNVKYSAIRLNNIINIVNSVQPWSEFLDCLAGDYSRKGKKQKAEDKNQSYRRFPFFLILHEEDYELGMNKGVFGNTREFQQYMMYGRLRNNMRQIADKCGNNVKLYNLESKKIVTPIVEKHKELEQIMQHTQKGTDEQIIAEFEQMGYGKQFGPTYEINAQTGEKKIIAPAPYVQVGDKILTRDEYEKAQESTKKIDDNERFQATEIDKKILIRNNNKEMRRIYAANLWLKVMAYCLEEIEKKGALLSMIDKMTGDFNAGPFWGNNYEKKNQAYCLTRAYFMGTDRFFLDDMWRMSHKLDMDAPCDISEEDLLDSIGKTGAKLWEEEYNNKNNISVE